MHELRDALRVLQDSLGVGLAEAARMAAKMSGAELDLVEAEKSPVGVASLVYQAQMRAAKRIADADARQAAIAAAMKDANRHHEAIRLRCEIDPHAADRGPGTVADRVYSEPPVTSGSPDA